MKLNKSLTSLLLAIFVFIATFGLACLLLNRASPDNPAISISNEKAFSKPLHGLTKSQNQKFLLGKNLFHGTSNDSRSLETRNIGPLFNAKTCGDCHGGGGISNPETSPSFNIKLYNHKSPDNEDPVYGSEIQTESSTDYFGEARIVQESYGQFSLEDMNFGALDNDTFQYSRIAQKIVGQGLIEAIPDQFFIDKSDPFDKDGDGISGKIAFAVEPTSNQRQIARFGTKATELTVRSQTLRAAFSDIGLTNSMFGLDKCLQRNNCNSSPEMSAEQEDFLVFYTRAIAPPRPQKPTQQSKLGKQIFRSTGCSSCHTESIRIDKTDINKHEKIYIHPMSDFLLHSMGKGLSDPSAIEGRQADEFRTAPLWGLGHIQKVNGSLNLLHDGRAKSIDQAVLLHGGEAQKAKLSYTRLSEKEKSAILKYLNSL